MTPILNEPLNYNVSCRTACLDIVNYIKKIKESLSQSLITDYIVRKRRATQNENEVCEDPWPLPQISIGETVSSDDEGDLEPLRKPLSDSDNEYKCKTMCITFP
ncbi:hypothetical protein TNCV_1049551 [Trichonephila clavipes]|nr:hypothetical protein TNCV_1049551 [Trichonephila clavipes]